MTTTVLTSKAGHTVREMDNDGDPFVVESLRLGSAHLFAYTSPHGEHTWYTAHADTDRPVDVSASVLDGTAVISFYLRDRSGHSHRVSLFGVDAIDVIAKLAEAIVEAREDEA